jgi:hypothetical protein
MDFHPNMLAIQRENPSPSRVSVGAGFHPNQLATQWQPGQAPRSGVPFHPDQYNQGLAGSMLPGMGTADTAPAAPLPFAYDAAAGTITIGGNTIKLIPAILTSLAVKLIFFSGDVAAKGARAAYSRLRGSTSAATNPGRGRGFRPYRAMVYGKGCKIVCSSRWGTKAAAQKWCYANEHRGAGSRINYVG